MALDAGLSLKALDVFPKTVAEFRQKTTSGGAVSLVCSVLILLLTVTELVDYMQSTVEEHLEVDTSRGRTMTITMDLAFPALPCSVVHLELQDVSGNHLVDLSRNITKERLDRDGRHLQEHELPKGNEEIAQLAKAASLDHGRDGAEFNIGSNKRRKPLVVGPGENVPLARLLQELLPNVVDDEAAVAEMRSHLGEGCHIHGALQVGKVAGNFHFAVDRNDQRTMMTVFGQRDSINMSHTVRSVSFGEPYPGLVNPLDGMHKIIDKGSGYFQYNMKVVPTIYKQRRGREVHTNQYSFTEIFRTTAETDRLPAVFFNYELSPIMATFTETSRGLGNFLTGLCAIVGGVFTLSGVVDALIFHLFAHQHGPSGMTA